MNPERSAYLMPGTQSVCDQLIRMELERCSYLNTDASRIRQWRLEDARNGIVWGDQSQQFSRDGSASNKPLPTNQ